VLAAAGAELETALVTAGAEPETETLPEGFELELAALVATATELEETEALP